MSQDAQTRWKPWHRWVLGGLGVLFVLVIIVAITSDGDTIGGEPEQFTPMADISVPNAPAEPDGATAAAYVADLDAIHPDIVHGKPEKAIDRGRNQCTSVAEWPNDQAKLVTLTEQRFTSPDHPDGFGEPTAARILSAVRKHLCP